MRYTLICNIIQVVTFSTILVTVRPSDAHSETESFSTLEQQLYIAIDNPEYREAHRQEIQASIKDYNPKNEARDLSVAYYSFAVADLGSAKSLCQNFHALQGDFKHFGEEELLNCFRSIFEGLVEKERSGIISLSEMELALLYDEVYLSSGDENLLDVDTLQFFSFERATVMASENPKLLDDPRVMVPVVNSDVCSAAHIDPNKSLPASSLCFDPVQYEKEFNSDAFGQFIFVREALKACSTVPRSEGFRCIPRLQEQFKPYGRCTLPVHLMRGDPIDSLDDVRNEIAACYKRNLKP
jgi:hypothetical protein